MSRGYTPGTYHVEGATVYVLNDGGTNRIHCSVNSGWKYGYDTINQKDERTSAEECEATARLFRAAPYLLEALEELLDADLYAEAEGICYIADSDTEDGECAVRKARAAITKVYGE